jgi:hypothetical protein
MRLDSNLLKNLANSANIINTINGGTVFPTFRTLKNRDHIRVEVTIPSIDIDSIKVEVNGDHLYLFQLVDFNGRLLPNILGILPLSRNIQLDEITASYEDEKLIVLLPYSELKGGRFRREINILKY